MGSKKYNLNDCAFYCVRTKSRLARILKISPKRLKMLANLKGGYSEFSQPKKGGGVREISAPIPVLKSVQSRIADLLSRVQTPDFLFAPVQGRSYVENAARHIGSNSIHLLDVEDFFPNCTEKKVIWFFHKRMRCSVDVAVILARLTTLDGSLPQGSPCSPFLAYFAYEDMWDEIFKITKKEGCKLSVYADDLTISGSTVPQAAIWEIKQTLFKHGHRYAKEKERSRRNRPVEVTGVVVGMEKVTVPNRQRQKIHTVKEDLRKNRSKKLARKLEAQLRGRFAQLQQVNAGNKFN